MWWKYLFEETTYNSEFETKDFLFDETKKI